VWGRSWSTLDPIGRDGATNSVIFLIIWRKAFGIICRI
jgi:hypothetical protein